MKLYLGEGISYSAEYFRVGAEYKRLEREGHGYVSQLVNNEFVYVWNGVRDVLVHRLDITELHNRKRHNIEA